MQLMPFGGSNQTTMGPPGLPPCLVQGLLTTYATENYPCHCTNPLDQETDLPSFIHYVFFSR